MRASSASERPQPRQPPLRVQARQRRRRCVRATYGTDFALTNSGGLRAPLSCPLAGPSGFCPTSGTTPPFPITRGSVLGVLPFGNFSVTMTLSGPELKSMLERGVSASPGRDGRYAQVSGLCFTFDIQRAAGSRVVGAVRQAADGSCTGAAVDLTGSTYTVATNDFTAGGGDATRTSRVASPRSV